MNTKLYAPRQVRMECLKMAVAFCCAQKPSAARSDDVVAVAEKFLLFVTEAPGDDA